MAYKYFIYSSEQLEFMKRMESKMGHTFKVGTVFNKGKRCSFTELSSSPNLKYSDSKIVAEGEESLFSYTPPRGV